MSTSGHSDARLHGGLTHVREDGSAHMVDVSEKAVTARVARAYSRLQTTPEVVAQVFDGSLPKGDAVSVARIAGIMAAKRTSELIPLCHPLPVSTVTVDIRPEADAGPGAAAGPEAGSETDCGTGTEGDQEARPVGGSKESGAPSSILVETLVKTTGVTGVEMEALTAASVAALTLYDMVKALDRGAVIAETGVRSKSGGASGDWVRV
ncbi:cyclic pyranopterin monophosphate synthase MoaC [Brevibacterium salitolerans]|uniref:Cyclic pyranopterin monophosphate synthase n=1 Tax=Brevibacterium salitolerans TaxID=1403566 RepID=A0ABP5ITK2_9MICO